VTANRPARPLLPLPPAAFHILVSLADRDRHGYSIMQEVVDRTGGEGRLHAGTLYATLKKLLADGLIRELDERPDEDSGDTRRRYYQLTKVGRERARAEAKRLAELVRQARASGLWLGSRE
jgi:DNA-binding PadR family transcriptional regulator